VPDAGARQLLHEVCVLFRVVFLAGIIKVYFSLGLQELIAKAFKTEEMMGLLGETGYKKPPSFSDRWEICSAIKIIICWLKTDQFKKGSEILGVLQMIKENEELMKCFFFYHKKRSLPEVHHYWFKKLDIQ